MEVIICKGKFKQFWHIDIILGPYQFLYARLDSLFISESKVKGYILQFPSPKIFESIDSPLN